MGKPTKILTAEEFDRLFNDKERFIRIAYSYINDSNQQLNCCDL